MAQFDSLEEKFSAYLSNQHLQNVPAIRQLNEYMRIYMTPPPVFGNRPFQRSTQPHYPDYFEKERIKREFEKTLRIFEENIRIPGLSFLNAFFDLGKPITDEKLSRDFEGKIYSKYLDFQKGTAYWSNNVGLQIVTGEIGECYKNLRESQEGIRNLGYPTQWEGELTNEFDTAPSFLGTVGKVRRFERGSIYWSEKTGAQPIHGGISQFYESVHGTASKLGFPIKLENEPLGEFDAATSKFGTPGRVRRFEGGSIYWSEKFGAYAVQGEISAHYEKTGGTWGPYGFPKSNERIVKPKSRILSQTFEGGSIELSPGRLY